MQDGHFASVPQAITQTADGYIWIGTGRSLVRFDGVLATIINSQPDMQVVGEAATGAEAIAKFRLHRPDVTLLDLRLPDMSGIDVLISIRTEDAAARVITLTKSEGDVEIQRAFKAGARSYVLKNMPPADLLSAIRQVKAGKRSIPPEVSAQMVEHMGDEQLSVREIEVLQHVAGGNRNRDIGEILFISEETVKVHLKNIMGTLGASDRSEAVNCAPSRHHAPIAIPGKRYE